MNQEEINREWMREFNSNIGTVTILTSPKIKTSGLKGPYEYRLTDSKLSDLISNLKDIGKAARIQCNLVDVKPLMYGKRIRLFFLGYPPGFTGDESGITARDWSRIAARLRRTIKILPGAKPYIEPWTIDDKFQMRFTAYVATSCPPA